VEEVTSGVSNPWDGAFEFIEKEELSGPLRELNKPDVFKRSLGIRSILRLRWPILLLEGRRTASDIMGEEGGRVASALFGVVGGDV
jgi:hypothetical protein